MGMDRTVLMFDRLISSHSKDRLISSHSKEHRYSCFVLLVMAVRWPNGGTGDGYCVLLVTLIGVVCDW